MSGLFFFESYADRLSEVMEVTDWEIVAPLALALFDAWKDKRQVFLAGNGGYDNIFSSQLPVFANAGDILWVMSGSGNSTNIIKVLEVAQELGLTSFAVLGFDGGRASSLADHVIHFPVNDMQVAEDLQMIVSNMIIQYLYSRRTEII